MNNLHIVVNSFRYGSRVLKETSSLVRSGLVDRAYIAALHENGLPERETIDEAREVWRAHIRSRGWPRTFVVMVIKYLEYCMRIFLYARKKNIHLINIHNVDLLPFGVLLKRIFKAKLVYDPHELETEQYGMYGARQKVMRRVERRFIGCADIVVVVSDGIKDWYQDSYGVKNIVVVRNCPEFRKPQRTKLLHKELGIPEGKKIILYQGGLVGGGASNCC